MTEHDQNIPLKPKAELSQQESILFSDLGLSKSILESIQQIGFTHPSPIQAKSIPIALSGKDLIGLAQTGSGKTAAFVLPLAEKLMHGQGLRGLILCPTREIALQTKAFLDLFGKSHDLTTVCIIGGVPMGPQVKGLKNNPDIVVATPGRLYDHMERKNISLNKIEYLVLDEADHMFDLGFLPMVEKILRKTPKERQSMMFSATLPPSVQGLMQMHLKDPQKVDVLPTGNAAVGIEHRLYLVDWKDKRNLLVKLLQKESGSTLVFIETKAEADFIFKILSNNDLPAAILHSNRTQHQRSKALSHFKDGKQRILIATDIASRGIDVPGIEHVINLDMPDNVEDYIHRAGRTARAGKSGIVSSIATFRDYGIIKKIEKHISQSLERCEIEGVKPYKELKRRR